MEKKIVKDDIFYLSTDIANLIEMKSVGVYLKGIEDKMKIKEVVNKKNKYYINYNAILFIVNKKHNGNKKKIDAMLSIIKPLKEEGESLIDKNILLSSENIKSKQLEDFYSILDTQKRIISNLINVQKGLQSDVKKLKVTVRQMEKVNGKHRF